MRHERVRATFRELSIRAFTRGWLFYVAVCALCLSAMAFWARGTSSSPAPADVSSLRELDGPSESKGHPPYAAGGEVIDYDSNTGIYTLEFTITNISTEVHIYGGTILVFKSLTVNTVNDPTSAVPHPLSNILSPDGAIDDAAGLGYAYNPGIGFPYFALGDLPQGVPKSIQADFQVPTNYYFWFTADVFSAELLVPVELLAFRAAAEVNCVVLQWSTASETENVGFHLYRSDSKLGSFTKITDVMIPGAGNSDDEHRYAYSDCAVEPGGEYFYKLADISYSGGIAYHGPVSIKVESAPAGLALEQNYPNPFSAQGAPSTAIAFHVSNPAHVQVRILNIRGRVVRTLMDAPSRAGNYILEWDARDQTGRPVSPGVYYGVATAGKERRSIKMVLTE